MSEKGIFHSYTKADRGKVDEILEKYGMLRYKNRPIGELSGGQMQRVFLCRAIISSPKILILDEPSTYVDSNFERVERENEYRDGFTRFGNYLFLREDYCLRERGIALSRIELDYTGTVEVV